MGKIFFWLTNPVDPTNILFEKWTSFLDFLGATFVLIVLAMVVIITLIYSSAAAARKIYKPADVFLPYTPMNWLWLSAVAALMAGGICAWRYADYLGPKANGVVTVSLWVGVWTGLWVLLLSYLLMMLPGITPSKFRYRPLWLFYRHRGVRM